MRLNAMKKDSSKRAINFVIDKNKAILMSAFAMKQDITLAKLLESLIDNFIAENQEQAQKLIQAYELNLSV